MGKLLPRLVLCVLAAAAPGVSLASGAKPKSEAHGGGGAGHETKPKEPAKDGLFAVQDNLVPLPTVIAPVVTRDKGQLVGHLYFYLAALTDTVAEANEVKARLPYVQDAMLRAVYQERLTVSDASQDPDTKALIARLKDVVNEAVEKPLVKELEVGRIDTAPY